MICKALIVPHFITMKNFFLGVGVTILAFVSQQVYAYYISDFYDVESAINDLESTLEKVEDAVCGWGGCSSWDDGKVDDLESIISDLEAVFDRYGISY